MQELKYMIVESVCAFTIIILSSLSSFGGTISYSYDNLNRLISVDYGNGLQESYAYDAAGNRASLAVTGNLDTIPPTGSILINSASTMTNSPVVTLALTCSDTGSSCSKMQFSNDGVTWSTPEAYTTTKAWTLVSGDGLKTVYAKYMDTAGNWSRVYTSSITLDTIPPVGSILINSAASATNSSVVTLSLTCSDNTSGCSQTQLSNDGTTWSTPEAYTATKPWTLVSGDGSKTVYVKYMDTAGNWSNVASYRIVLDTIPPTSSISKPSNGENIFTNIYTIQGTANDGSGTGIQKVQISTDGGATWNPATGTNAWTFVWSIPGIGAYNIKTKSLDNAGNEQLTVSAITVTAIQDKPTPVTINGRQMLVGGAPFTMKGVLYEPTPIGDNPEAGLPYGDYFTANYNGIYTRDFILLRNMGANTIRLYGWDSTADHLDFLDNAYNGGLNPIYVIAGYWINPGLDIDPASPANVRKQLVADFGDMVNVHKNHPAILMWAIGNDMNSSNMYGGNLTNLFSLINDMAAEAHMIEGAAFHPVAIALSDSDLIKTIATYNATVTSLDIWGANVYRGNTFGTLFSDYKATSTKPLAVLEYGIDAYDYVHGNEYEKLGVPYQADYADALWKELITNSDVSIGGSIVEYSDQWWKGNFPSGTSCPDTNPSVHSDCGFAETFQPDGFSNEEWHGIMRVVQNPSGPDTMQPRSVYYTLQSDWVPSPNISVNPSSIAFDSIQVGSSSQKSVVVNNTGTANLAISSVAITPSSNDFSQTNNCSSVAPGGSCSIAVTFKPSSVGAKSATLGITSNSNGMPVMNVPLTGSGTNSSAGALSINSGAVYTKKASVTLTLSCTGTCTKMQFSNDNVTWSTPVNYASTKAWTLTSGDGLKTVYVKFGNAVGTWSAAYSATITLDTAVPVTTASVAGGTYNTVQTVSLTCKDGTGSGCDKIYYTTDKTTPTTASGVYSGPIVIASNMTLKYFATDLAGNSETVKTQTYIVNAGQPTGTIVINAGAAYTHKAAVTLTLTCSDSVKCTQMQFSNDNATWSTPVSYASTRSWTLTTGDGVKTVYVKFGNAVGTWSTVYSATITLDTTVPVTTASVLGGTYNQVQTVSLACSDGTGSGCDKIYYTTDKTTPTTASGVYSAPIGVASSMTLKYFATDLAGNRETVKTQAYVVNAGHPTGTIAINGGAAYANKAAVTLTLTCSDSVKCTQMQFSNDNVTWSAPVTYASTKSWTLATGEGLKTVYAKFGNAVGTWSTVYSASITLDTVAPVNGTLSATVGKAQVGLQWTGFSDASSGIAGYTLVYGTKGVPSSCSAGTQLYAGSGTAYVHTGLSSGTTYYYRVCATDNAGNISTGSTVSAKP